jgi:hypothetical protein
VLRFTPPRSRSHHRARWPEVKRPPQRTPFSRRPDLEILSVVIDAELLEREHDSSPPSRGLLLAGLLTHQFVRLLRYSEAGPPAHLPRHDDALSSDAVAGWIVVTGHDSAREGWGVLAADDKSVLKTGIIGNATTVAAEDIGDSSYGELSREVAAERRKMDVIAAQAADAVDADIFITERPYLHSAQWEIADGLLIATPEQALPLVSLYLRAQDVFIGWRDSSGKSTTTLTRGSFYSTAAVELVPSSWPALNALAEHTQAGGPREPFELLRAVLGRLQQALAARDSMYSALNRPQDNDAADETLSAFDLALLTLMGAVDASARIADLLLGLNLGEHAAGWNAKGWRKRAREASPEIDAVFSDGRHQHALTILTELRNTIHGSQIGPLAVATQRKQIRTVIELPPDAASRLLSAINNRGGHERWGITTPIRGRVHADPARLLDALLEDVTAMLDGFVEAMPVSSLVGVNPANAPLPQTRLWVFGDVPRESILWQLGL